MQWKNLSSYAQRTGVAQGQGDVAGKREGNARDDGQVKNHQKLQLVENATVHGIIGIPQC